MKENLQGICIIGCSNYMWYITSWFWFWFTGLSIIGCNYYWWCNGRFLSKSAIYPVTIKSFVHKCSRWQYLNYIMEILLFLDWLDVWIYFWIVIFFDWTGSLTDHMLIFTSNKNLTWCLCHFLLGQNLSPRQPFLN